jgi:multidrug efflux pump subunit AcrB
MSDESTPEAPSGGAIAWMARNPVASNLLMFVILLGGLFTMLRVKQEVFPSFELDIVGISVPYPGASPAEVEQGVVLAVEEAVRALDGVKRVSSTSSEGMGNVSVEVLLGEDPDKVLNDVKSAVDRVASFPEEAEQPTIALLQGRQTVVSLILSGDLDLATLHRVAEDVRLKLLDAEDITQVDIEGVPPLEVAIEVPRENLEKYGLTLDDVAAQVRLASLELPGGAVETAGGEVLVRVSDRRKSADEFARIPLRGTAGGAIVLLGDIATVRDGYADTKQESYYDGRRAVRLVAYRVGDETPKAVAAAVHEQVAALRAELPPTVHVDTWDDDSVILADRIELLTRNGAMGLVLVLIVLALFLDLRLAFWVGLGIPICFMGAFLVMPMLGLSINMITLFALIITLGMVVDDAIVIGENAFEKMQSGMPRMRAAIEGAREMSVPVTFAILTTIAAFSPLFFVPGVMGKIFRLFPAVVIAVLLFSLLESFFVLPAHLAHGEERRAARGVMRVVDAPRRWMSGLLEGFTDGPYRRWLGRTLELRYAAFATGVAGFVVAVGLVCSGIVPASFFPIIEGDVVTASVRLPYGAPLQQTRTVREQLEAASAEALAEVGGQDIVVGMFSRIGEGRRAGGPAGGGAEIGSHLVTIELELVPSAERDVSADEVATAWAAAMPSVPGLESITFSAASGPGAGAAIDMQLSHPDQAVLEAASVALTDALRGYSELRNVTNGFAAGKAQYDYTLLPQARTLGLSSNDLARQLRSAFYGAEALREQRGRNEVKVMVRLPERQRTSEHDLDQLRIRTAQGGFAPLGMVAEATPGRAATSIKRRDGLRTINVSADLQPDVPSPRPVLESVGRDVYPKVLADFPGLDISPVGQAEAQRESLASLGPNYILALFVIYALLAIPFRSYIQPLIVMSAIPFGFIGAVVGHLVMGYELSLISAFGIIALSGVVVNDSLVLIDTTNRYRREGASAWEAIVRGATRRMRPILLTSLTTFFGLMPMIFETSMQARFLIPMAISLGFGILFATAIVLLLVPALYLIFDDFAWLEDRINAAFLRAVRSVARRDVEERPLERS